MAKKKIKIKPEIVRQQNIYKYFMKNGEIPENFFANPTTPHNRREDPEFIQRILEWMKSRKRVCKDFSTSYFPEIFGEEAHKFYTLEREFIVDLTPGNFSKLLRSRNETEPTVKLLKKFGLLTEQTGNMVFRKLGEETTSFFTKELNLGDDRHIRVDGREDYLIFKPCYRVTRWVDLANQGRAGYYLYGTEFTHWKEIQAITGQSKRTIIRKYGTNLN